MQLRATQVRTLKALHGLHHNTGVGSLRDLADELGVEPTTTRNAILRLEEKGLVSYSTKGKGKPGTVRLLAAGRKLLTKAADGGKVDGKV